MVVAAHACVRSVVFGFHEWVCVRVFVWFRLGCFIVTRRSFELCVVDLICLVWNFVDCLCVCIVLFVLRRFLLCEV